MDTFTWIPSQGGKLTDTPRVLSMKFGDGYEQRAPDGINNIDTSWDVSFTHRTDKEFQDILNFLRALQGVGSFLWRPPTIGGVKDTYLCRKWDGANNEHNDFEVTGTFERDFSSFIPHAAAPTFTLAAGSVSLASATGGAVIYYTFDPGGFPALPNPDYENVTTHLYTAPFAALTGTYQAIATTANLRDSVPTLQAYE